MNAAKNMTIREVINMYFEYLNWFTETNHFCPHSDANFFVANEIADLKGWDFDRAERLVSYIIINY